MNPLFIKSGYAIRIYQDSGSYWLGHNNDFVININSRRVWSDKKEAQNAAIGHVGAVVMNATSRW